MMNRIDRRTFIRSSACAAGAAALTSCAPARLTTQTPPAPCPSTAWQKHGIILETSESWEGGDIQNFTSPAELLKGGAWCVWYSVSGKRDGYGIAYAEGVPGKPMKKFPVECF